MECKASEQIAEVLQTVVNIHNCSAQIHIWKDMWSSFRSTDHAEGVCDCIMWGHIMFPMKYENHSALRHVYAQSTGFCLAGFQQDSLQETARKIHAAEELLSKVRSDTTLPQCDAHLLQSCHASKWCGVSLSNMHPTGHDDTLEVLVSS